VIPVWRGNLIDDGVVVPSIVDDDCSQLLVSACRVMSSSTCELISGVILLKYDYGFHG